MPDPFPSFSIAASNPIIFPQLPSTPDAFKIKGTFSTGKSQGYSAVINWRTVASYARSKAFSPSYDAPSTSSPLVKDVEMEDGTPRGPWDYRETEVIPCDEDEEAVPDDRMDVDVLVPTYHPLPPTISDELSGCLSSLSISERPVPNKLPLSVAQLMPSFQWLGMAPFLGPWREKVDPSVESSDAATSYAPMDVDEKPACPSQSASPSILDIVSHFAGLTFKLHIGLPYSDDRCEVPAKPSNTDGCLSFAMKCLRI